MRDDADPDIEFPSRVPVVQDDLRLEVSSPDVDAARPPDPLGIGHTSPEEVMRSELRLVHALVCQNVCWDSKMWLQGRLLCNERWRLNSKLVVKGCQNRKSPQRFFLFQNSRLGKKRKPVILRTSREVATREAALQREMAAELEARRQGLSEQEKSSAFFLVPKLTSWEEEKTRDTTHFPRSGYKGGCFATRDGG